MENTQEETKQQKTKTPRNVNRKQLQLKYEKHYLRYSLKIKQDDNTFEELKFSSLEEIAKHINASYDTSWRIYKNYYEKMNSNKYRNIKIDKINQNQQQTVDSSQCCIDT